jgi:hypothetical protein
MFAGRSVPASAPIAAVSPALLRIANHASPQDAGLDQDIETPVAPAAIRARCSGFAIWVQVRREVRADIMRSRQDPQMIKG